MNKKITHPFHVFCVLSAFVLLVIFCITPAFAEFYVIAGSRGVGTEIKSLPHTISAPGFYYITKDLSGGTGTHGITITADNVTLDLMGFSLVGPGGTGSFDGIFMSHRINVEIRNGTVRNFSRHGIYEDNLLGTGHRIVNIRTEENAEQGIYLAGRSHTVERCAALMNGGAGIVSGLGATIAGNTCFANTLNGIYAGSGATVSGNTCYDNTDTGISADYGSTITGNTCYDNGADDNDAGIAAGPGSTVIGNTCYNNTNYGIFLGGDNLVDQNTATGNVSANVNACSSCEFGNNRTLTTVPVP